MKMRDALERLFWTFVAGFLSTLLGAPVLVQVIEGTADVSLNLGVWGMLLIAASFSGLTAVGNAITLIARWRLSVLPNPGEGLPPVTRWTNARDAGTTRTDLLLAGIMIGVMLGLVVWAL